MKFPIFLVSLLLYGVPSNAQEVKVEYIAHASFKVSYKKRASW